MDMDIDMDIDINIDAEYQQEPTQQPVQQTQNPAVNVSLPDDPLNEIEGDVLPEKVHIRGLDNLSTNQLKSYANEHYPLNDDFVRVEWVDDTSANFIFTNAEAALAALSALTDSSLLSAVQSGEITPLQLRPAKSSSHNSEARLFVRQGTTIDVKRKNAAEASRYYLFNPEQDPRHRRRQRDEDKNQDEGDYNRRQFDGAEHKRRRNDSTFDVDMYDDNDSSTKRARSHVRSRNRSASPGRHSGYSRLRSASPTRNAGKELFASKTKSNASNIGKELFSSPVNSGKELFPTGTNQNKDLLSNSTATFPSASASLNLPSPLPPYLENLSRSGTPAGKRSSFSNHRRSDAVDASSRPLSERISGRSSEDLRIRGASDRNDFSIKGASSPGIKELFPLKAGNGGNANMGKELIGGNTGKELFGDRVKRANPRHKADDAMFG